jgi:hypothetical protein
MNKKKVTKIFTIIIIFTCFSSIGTSLKIETNSSNADDIKLIEECSDLNTDISIDEYAQPISDMSIEPTSFNSFDWRDVKLTLRGDWTPGNGDGYNFMTVAKSQGKCGSCWAFATVGALEAGYKIMHQDPYLSVNFSEQYMVSCATWLDFCFGCSGAFDWIIGDNFLDWAQDNDMLPESCFVYQSEDGNPPPCEAKCPDWQSKLIEVADEDDDDNIWLHSEGEMKTTLQLHGPLVAFMDIYADFKGEDKAGNDFEPSFPDLNVWPNNVYQHTCGEYLGRHVVVIVGWDDSLGCWICKNSWGPSWGPHWNGYFKIKYGDSGINDNVAYVRLQDTVNLPDLWAWTDDDAGVEDYYISWDDVAPGQTVEGNIYLTNLGDSGSLLDWEVASYPSWGTWSFNPNGGKDVATDDSRVEIKVSVTAPMQENKDFTGTIVVKNSENVLDYWPITVSLSTSSFSEGNLDCIDVDLSWSDVTPGTTKTGSFKVKNIGETGSLLDWEIADYSSSLDIYPLDGSNLESGGSTQVTVTLSAPDEKLRTYIGFINVTNRNDKSDYTLLPIRVTTVKQRNFFTSLSFFQFFKRANYFSDKLDLFKSYQNVKRL